MIPFWNLFAVSKYGFSLSFPFKMVKGWFWFWLVQRTHLSNVSTSSYLGFPFSTIKKGISFRKNRHQIIQNMTNSVLWNPHTLSLSLSLSPIIRKKCTSPGSCYFTWHPSVLGHEQVPNAFQFPNNKKGSDIHDPSLKSSTPHACMWILKEIKVQKRKKKWSERSGSWWAQT